MKRLAIDTSTDRATIAIEVGDEIFTAEQYGVRQHAALLLPMIQQLMTEASLKFSDLEEIVFGCGPGSFTGLRVTCSVAKALAYAHNLPLCPVNSLQTIAKAVDFTKSDYCLAMIDARMHEVYWAVYDQNSLIMPVTVSAMKDLKIDLSGSIALAGVGFNEYINDLQVKVVQSYEVYPDASLMFKCTDGCKRVSANDAQPIYIRNNIGVNGG